MMRSLMEAVGSSPENLLPLAVSSIVLHWPPSIR